MIARLLNAAACAALATGIQSALAQNAAAQGASAQAGVAAAVRGQVVLVAVVPQPERRAVGANVRSGDPIFLGDTIETGPDAGLQIMLMDETIFTIGPDAALIIDEFVYDPATDAGKVTASVLKGAFRFVSGRVAKEEPRNMSVRTPVGTIGIRGTSAAGRVIPPDPGVPGSQTSADVVLLGPGADNNAGERAGRIIVSNANTSVEIARSGFGTRIAGIDAPPTVPARFDPGVVANLTGDLGTARQADPDGDTGPGTRTNETGDPASDGRDGGDAGDQAGGEPQTGADAGRDDGNADGANQGPSRQANASPQPGGGGQGDAGTTPAAGTPGIGLSQTNALSGQNIGAGIVNTGVLGQIANAQAPANQQLLAAIENEGTAVNTAIATFDQLRSLETGTATYDFGTVALVQGPGASAGDGGSYTPTLKIDFGARTIDFTITNVLYTIGGSGGHTFAFDDSVSQGGTYDNDNGPAKEDWDNVSNAANFTTLPTAGHTVDIEGQINNNLDTGEIAASATVSVKINSGGAQIQGGKTTPRQ